LEENLKKIMEERERPENDISGSEIIQGMSRAAPIGIGIVISRVFVFVNDFLCDMIEYSREELIGKNSRMIYPSNREYEFVGKEKYGQLEKYGAGTVDTLFKTKSGRILNVILSSSFVDNKNPLKGTIFTVLDITERKKAQELIRESEEKYRRIVDTANEGVWSIDDHYITTFVNSKMADMLGYTVEEMVGKSAGIFLYDDTIASQVNRMGARTEGLSQSYELPLKKKNGDKLWTFVSATPILDKEDNFKGSFAMFTDITERKRFEYTVKQLNDNLKLMNKILRHDISNDLTVVSIALEMIETKDVDMKNRAFNAIKRSVELIEKMRVLESSMSTRYTLKQINIDQVLDFLKKTYPNIKIKITGHCNVTADEAFISVIDNILNNAIVHGKSNNIDIEINSDENSCQMKIIDYGKGIPEEIKEKIFDEEFSYGATKGTGLGLYISKKTIERYGGTIEVKDTKPHGATFIITLKKDKL
jgi:PAS domain S-box-containing protein